MPQSTASRLLEQFRLDHRVEQCGLVLVLSPFAVQSRLEPFYSTPHLVQLRPQHLHLIDLMTHLGPVLSGVESAMTSLLTVRVVIVSDVLLWTSASDSGGGTAAFR